jgi:hypothetical protein
MRSRSLPAGSRDRKQAAGVQVTRVSSSAVSLRSQAGRRYELAALCVRFYTETTAAGCAVQCSYSSCICRCNQAGLATCVYSTCTGCSETSRSAMLLAHYINTSHQFCLQIVHKHANTAG